VEGSGSLHARSLDKRRLENAKFSWWPDGLAYAVLTAERGAGGVVDQYVGQDGIILYSPVSSNL
jgi:hypothetical protein